MHLQLLRLLWIIVRRLCHCTSVCHLSVSPPCRCSFMPMHTHRRGAPVSRDVTVEYDTRIEAEAALSMVIRVEFPLHSLPYFSRSPGHMTLIEPIPKSGMFESNTRSGLRARAGASRHQLLATPHNNTTTSSFSDHGSASHLGESRPSIGYAMNEQRR